MLETIREFALERLEESGEEARVRRRHAKHCLEVAERAEPELRSAAQGAWLNRLEAEHGNMRAALRFLAEEGEVELSLRLGGALSHFWNVSGYHAEGRARLTEVLRPAGARAHPASRAKVLCELGFLTIDQGDDATARVLIEESLSILRARGDRHGVARGLVGLAWIANDEGDFAMGRALHEESLSIMRELGDGRGIALALNGLGNFASVHSDHAAARACHEESLAIMRALGDRYGVSRALVGLAWVGIDQQDHAGARGVLAESLAIAHGLGYPRVVIDGLETFAYLAVAVDRMDRAARLQGAAEALRETIGVPLTTMERAQYDPAAVRASLELAAAWEEGRAMSVEQAVAYALDEQPSA
jgi:non-specific serine/threonine protein kinase